MRLLWSRPTAALVCAAVLGTGSCGGDEATSSGAPTSGGGGAGEPIRDGFRVVDGSELIGPAFPIGAAYSFEGRPVVDGGFRAILEVRGDPRDVIDGYLEQARDLGLTEAPAPESGAGASGGSMGEARCESRGEGAHEFTCGGFARNDDEATPRSLLLSFARGRVEGVGSFSHLEMRYSTTPPYWKYGASLASGLGGADAVNPPPVPEGLGEISDSALFSGWPPVAPLDVVDGTRPVLQMPSFDCTAFTPLAVLQVVADPETVMDGYAQQFSAITNDDVQVDAPLEVAGGRLLVVRASEAGGVEYVAHLFETDQETWLLIESCYD